MSKYIGISFIYKYINLYFIKRKYSIKSLIAIGIGGLSEEKQMWGLKAWLSRSYSPSPPGEGGGGWGGSKHAGGWGGSKPGEGSR